MASKSINHPELGMLKLGNIHPYDSKLKYCIHCNQFKNKHKDFTSRKSACKKCRTEKLKQEYWDKPEKRKYHVKKQREYMGGVSNPTVFFDEDDPFHLDENNDDGC